MNLRAHQLQKKIANKARYNNIRDIKIGTDRSITARIGFESDESRTTRNITRRIEFKSDEIGNIKYNDGKADRKTSNTKSKKIASETRFNIKAVKVRHIEIGSD